MASRPCHLWDVRIEGSAGVATLARAALRDRASASDGTRGSGLCRVVRTYMGPFAGVPIGWHYVDKLLLFGVS